MSRGALEPRAGYEQLRRYSPGPEAPAAIDLSDNTNRWGMPPQVVEALGNLDASELTRYPSPYAADLKQVIGSRTGVDASCIVTGTGSDGVLEPAIRAFARPGDRMVLANPTFVMAAPFGRMNGLEPVFVDLGDDYDVDADAMLASGARVTYVCSPNNPTGTVMSATAAARIVAEANGLVIIDEAYVEFASSSFLELALASERVLLIRTFSKAYGLAGLRVGYGIGSPSVIDAVEKARGPYTVGTLSDRAARAAMGPGFDWVRSTVNDAVAARSGLLGALTALGLEPAPSQGNFVFVPVRHAARIAARLEEQGIRLRAFSGMPEINDALRSSGGEALRITVGPDAMMAQVIAALEDAVRKEARE